MLDYLISVVLEFFLYRLGVIVVGLCTFGKIKPTSYSNPFFYGFVGLSFIILVACFVTYNI